MAHEISAVLSANEKEEIKKAYDIIMQKLPFALDLSVDERKAGHKIGPKRRDFSHFMLRVTKDHPEILPDAFSVTEFEKDSVLETEMLDVLGWSTDVYEKINDTHLEVGREKYTAARKVYEYLKSAQGLDELKKQAAEYFDAGVKEELAEQEPPVQ